MARPEFVLQGETFALSVDDLSMGGLGLRSSAREGSGLMPGQQLRRVRLELGQGGPLAVDLEIRSRRAFRSAVLEILELGGRHRREGGGEWMLLHQAFSFTLEHTAEVLPRTHLESNMKHSTEELILAAHIRDTIADRMALYMPAGMTAEAAERWRQDRVKEYVHDALAELDVIADLVKLEERQP
jgi:hypothetical protein